LNRIDVGIQQRKIQIRIQNSFSGSDRIKIQFYLLDSDLGLGKHSLIRGSYIDPLTRLQP